MPRAPVNLLSSNKITISDCVIKSSLLSRVWGGVFYHPDFIASAARILGLVNSPVSIESETKVIGAANFLHNRRTFFRAATTPLLFQYYGPLMLDTDGDNISSAFDSYLSSQFDFVYLSLPPDIKTSYFSDQWRFRPQITPAILSGNLKSWGDKFRDDVKNKIRKARREKIEISLGDTFPSDLWQLTFSRRGLSPPIKPESLSSWCNELTAASLLKIYLAKLDSKIVAFRCQLIFGAYAYDWLAGSDPQYHSTGANQLLMAEIGSELARQNLEAWDMVGGQISAIDDFKMSFGAMGIPHLHAIRAFNIKGRLFESLRKLRHA
jgi:hypothetical protein